MFVGSLPLLDNWEIFGGLIFGTFISIVVLPYITFGKWDVLQKKIILAVTIPITIVMYVFILYLFFEVQNVSDNCPSCKAFNCASYTDNNCEIEKLVWILMQNQLKRDNCLLFMWQYNKRRMLSEIFRKTVKMLSLGHFTRHCHLLVHYSFRPSRVCVSNCYTLDICMIVCIW